MADNEVQVPFEMQIPKGAVGGLVESPDEINKQKQEGIKLESSKTEVKEPTKVENTINEPTDEQIQTKLDELAKKEETTLTEEDKKFIDKHVPPIDEVTGVKQSFEQKFGVTLEKTYSNDETGLAEITEDVSKIRATQLLTSYFEQIPYMKEFYDHVITEKRGIETFLAKNIEPSFKSIKLESTSDANDQVVNDKIIANQKALVKADLTSKGVPEEDANTLIDLYEDKSSLFDKAKEAYKALETKYKASVDAKLAEEESRIKANEADSQKIFTEMQTMLDKNSFDGVTIPTTDIKAFKEAMLKPVDDQGRTIMDYKRAKLTLAQRAIIDYIVFKDLKVTGLGQATTIVQNKAFTFKKAATENEKRNGGRTNAANSTEDLVNNPMDVRKINFGTIKIERQ